MGQGSQAANTPMAFGKQSEAQAEAISEILPGRLYLGSAEAAHQVDLLKTLGIKNVVNCTEMRPFHPNEFAQHACPVSDSPSQDIAQHFDEVMRYATRDETHARPTDGRMCTARVLSCSGRSDRALC